MQGKQKIPLRPLVTKKVPNIGGGQNQEMTDIRVYSVKELAHFVDQYHQLPEEPLVKWIVSVTSLGAESLILNAAEWKRMFGLMQDQQVTIKQLQMAKCDPDTKKLIPKGTPRLERWVKATVYLEKGDGPTSPINAPIKHPR